MQRSQEPALRRAMTLSRHLTAAEACLPVVARKLDGKACVVTGAASGIGKATAELFAQHGASVLCVDINAKAVEAAAAEINEAVGSEVAAGWAADVGDEAASQGIVDECVRRFGKIDVYFANAGILGRYTEIKDMDISAVNRTLGVNLVGPMLAVKYASAPMLEAGEGAIICTASIASIRADLTPLEYSASKAGVRSVVQSAGDRFAGTGVRINGVLPGFVMTGITDSVQKEMKESGHRVSGFDYGKFPPASPEEVAAVVLFLASEDASFIQGQTIVADGGISNSMGFKRVKWEG